LAYCLRDQGKYAEAERAYAEAARAFEAARLAVSGTDLRRSGFGSRQNPLPGWAALLARQGRAAEAWQRLEESLARGLLDELSARAGVTRPPDDQRRRQGLVEQLARAERQLQAHLARRDALEAGRPRLEELVRQRREAVARLQ